MDIHPTISALRKHKAGVALIGVQIAFTIAIVCNILFVVSTYSERINRPTGLVEENLFLISQDYVNGNQAADFDTLDSMQLTDLSALRSIPDVAAASPVSSLPLLRHSSIRDVSLTPNQQVGITRASFFYGDDQLLPTLGLKLISGRDFEKADVVRIKSGNAENFPSVIITKALADKLFPEGGVVGKPLYVNGGSAASVVIGVVERMLTSDADVTGDHVWNGVLVPARVDSASTMYAVRIRTGRLNHVMDESRKILFATNPLRIIQESGPYSPSGIHSFSQIRSMGYALDIFVTQVLSVICAVLLTITCVGIAGLTNFWVGQRYRHIGIRRALGATKVDIVKYFQFENLIIASGGCLIGAILAVAANMALLRLFETDRISISYVIFGILGVVLLGQLSAFFPAWRASKIPPALATRSS